MLRREAQCGASSGSAPAVGRRVFGAAISPRRWPACRAILAEHGRRSTICRVTRETIAADQGQSARGGLRADLSRRRPDRTPPAGKDSTRRPPGITEHARGRISRSDLDNKVTGTVIEAAPTAVHRYCDTNSTHAKLSRNVFILRGDKRGHRFDSKDNGIGTQDTRAKPGLYLFWL